jgi:hypothetical protein
VAFSVGRGRPLLKELIGTEQYAEDVVALFALPSAILTSTLTFLAPSERAGGYHHFSNRFRALRDRTRSFIEIDCARAMRDAALRSQISLADSFSSCHGHGVSAKLTAWQETHSGYEMHRSKSQ